MARFIVAVIEVREKQWEIKKKIAIIKFVDKHILDPVFLLLL